MTNTADPGQHMDVLYSELQPQLVRILATNLQAPEWVIDDACQTAWGSLLIHREAVEPGSELGWLSTTATRSALRVLRRDRRAAPLEVAEPIRLDGYRTSEPGPERQLELRERLAEIRRLPIRQQRIVLLQGMGYDYVEIAAVTGDSRRTVARQLTRARQRLARLAGEG
ncbi:MAG TPA: sigma-70 family RNA polymerase sigma factor [Solirubrobacteraceae bacterium]|jgi:RNA polymerase sigma factor (sigma-70 family)|nr:sigma-70 family RNA polymerase sigma factor [Solirubrobacteraceae bacterium]